MKTLKKLFYGISICIVLVCVAILAIAMNPDLSERIATALYGEENVAVQATDEPTQMPEETESTATEEPQNTPLVMNENLSSDEAQSENGQQEPDGTDDYEPKTIDIKTVCPPQGQVSSYVEPVTDTVTVPSQVNGLCGYTEISASMSEVNKEEAEKLKEEANWGDLGSLLVFEKDFYPYYHMLNDTEKELYRQIYANAYAMNESFTPCIDIFSTNLSRVVEAVFNDNPVLFWVETSYGCKYGPDGRVVEISLQYNETSGKAEQSRQKFDEKAEEILSVARTLGSDYEKEKYVHDKLAAKITYAADATMSQSAYSALVNGQTVCAGYARAFQYLMQQLGIPCYYCRGYAGENHAWNIVELYGDYYNVDLTWDDAKLDNYDYFNKTDEDFAATHIRKSLSVNLPACTGTLYRNLEQSDEDAEYTGSDAEYEYSEALAFYYEKLCDRIEALGQGSASYSDIMDAEVWKELEEAYANGNHEFRDTYLVRALQAVDAEYCIISLSAEPKTSNAYEVNCSIVVK